MELSEEINRTVAMVRKAIEKARKDNPELDYGLRQRGNIVDVKITLQDSNVSFEVPTTINTHYIEDEPKKAPDWGNSKIV